MIVVITTDPGRLPECVSKKAALIVDASPGRAPRVIANRFPGLNVPDPGTIQINNVSIVGGGPLGFSELKLSVEVPKESAPDAFQDFLDGLDI